MDVKFYLDLLLKEEIFEENFLFVEEKIKVQKENPIWVQEKLLITQEKIRVQVEKEPTMVQEEAKEENHIFLKIQE